MKPDRVVSVHVGDTVAAAAKCMREYHVGCLVVTDRAGNLAGILTERDLVNKVVAAGSDQGRVEDVMTSNVAWAPPDTPVSKIRELMISHGVRHLPLVEGGKAVAIVSVRDVIAQQLARDRAMKTAAEQVAMLSTFLKSLDFDEVVSIVVQEVPKIFHAERCVLVLPGYEGANGGSLVRRNYCGCPKRELCLRCEQPVEENVQDRHRHEVPDLCRENGGKSPFLTIPVCVADETGLATGSGEGLKGFVCMCGMRWPASMVEELVDYKVGLVSEILSANLTNARVYQEARRRSVTDPLTGVGTRRVFEETLEAECVRAGRYDRPFCVGIVDVDHFKAVNDELGHAAGDRALRELAQCMGRQKRASDVLARYGGDEFVLLMPETALEDAVKVMERIRKEVARIGPGGVPMTISVGVAERRVETAVSGNELVRRADLALYEAKRDGRNCTQTWAALTDRLKDGGKVESERVNELQSRLAQMSVQSKDMFVQSIWGLICALEARDPYTKNHSENVMRYAVGIAETLNIEPEEVAVIRRGAMIHDIGKIGVPDAVLRKPGALTPAERRIMEQHPLIAVRILDQMRFLEREIPIVHHHHERWDGRGYPDGLAADTAPRGARILAVADAFDAITSDRVYRRSRSLTEAMEIISEGAGSHFDPEIARGMAAWVEKVAAALPDPRAVCATDLLEAQSGCSLAA